MISPALYSSAETEWHTPRWLFDQLNERYKFEIDAAATVQNALCHRYFTKEMDGLKQPWTQESGLPTSVYVNPPYDRKIGDWVHKAIEESFAGTRVVMLVPCRTDTKWFRNAFRMAAQLLLIEGRLKFGSLSKNGKNTSAPFPSCVFHFTNKVKMGCITSYLPQPQEEKCVKLPVVA